ncbi:MAG TPA: hypothetical protein PKD72_07865, partial [Gemmatales bacterium]|nr:hypothetical protein [Gemmatales bacterium]
MLQLRVCRIQALLALVFLVTWSGHVRGQGAPAEAQVGAPITIYADRVLGWSEDNQHGLYARGNVSIERGTTRIKMRDAILWVTKAREGEEPRAILYGEGAVTLEENRQPRRSLERIRLQWKMNGELRVIAPEKPAGQPAANDPVYLRAREVLLSPPPIGSPITEETPQVPPSTTETAKPETSGSLSEQVVRQRERDFTQQPISPSPDVANVLNRSSTLGISSRTSSPYQYRILPSNPGEYTAVFWGGLTLYAGDENSIIDISSDRVVVWAKGITGNPGQGVPDFSNFRKEQVEIYLEGNVEIRYRRLQGPSAQVDQLVLADRGYYDLGRNVALLSKCELIYNLPGLRLPIHVQAAEVRQLDLNNFQANDAVFFASRLPSDPDLKVMSGNINIELRDMPRKGLFGATAFDPIRATGAADAQIYGIADDVQIRFMDFTIGA